MKLLLLITSFFLFTKTLFSQDAQVSITLLANDKIAEVNVEQEKFIEGLVQVKNYLENHFRDTPGDQKMGVLLIIHKTGKPSVTCYSKPKLSKVETDKLAEEISNIQVDNTKLVDFPIFFGISVEVIDPTIFEDFVNPVLQKKKEYELADLATKFQLNKEYAINEALPVLGAYEQKADAQFEGVKNLGKLVLETDFGQTQDVNGLFNSNTNYWRAGLEMEVGNQIVPGTKIFALVSQGEFDYAREYLNIVRMFSSSKNTTNDYLEELNWRLRLFYKELNAKVGEGVTLHDQAKYDEALKKYEEVLIAYPNSAHALYEQYFSNNEKQVAEKKIELGNVDNWYKAKPEVYKHNPLYNVDVKATNGKEMYLIARRQELPTLFKKKEDHLKDVYKYAEIAQDLSVYDFAAQLFWFSVTYDTERSEMALKNYLYCLDKLGETKLKSNFKIDCDKAFKKIEKDKKSEMEESSWYQMMAK